MSNLKLQWMADELRDAGLTVGEHDGWKTRTNSTRNIYDPVGILNHHTAGSSILVNYPDPPYWTNSSLDYRCNITIWPNGVVIVLNAGYAYDSGMGDPLVLNRLLSDRPVLVPTDHDDSHRINGNPHFIDIEVQHVGDGSLLHPPQREALIATNEVLLGHYDWDPMTRLLGHREWTKRKVDPQWNGLTNPMPIIRLDTAEWGRLDIPPSDWTGEVIMSLSTLSEGAGYQSKGLAHLRPDVKSAQALLMARGFKDRKSVDPETLADGWFGPGTRDSTVRFQASVNLSRDGVIGPNTWRKLLNQ